MLNPLVGLPVFMSLSAPLSRKAARQTAIKAIITALTCALTFAVGGNMIFKLFGISIDSLQLAGGFVIFMMGYDMLQAHFKRTEETIDDLEDSFTTDFAITPIGIPLLCGPTALTMFILRMQEAHTVVDKVSFFIAAGCAGVTIFFIFIFGRRISEFLGEAGSKVILRIMGLILMIMAVEFMAKGAKPIVREILNIPIAETSEAATRPLNQPTIQN